MRFHGRELGLGRRLGVTTRTIIGGLLVLLVVAAVSCEDAEPNATVEPALPGPLVEVTDVEVVYASRERQPPFLFTGDYDPLWGDLDTDVPIIEKLLNSIVMGTPVDLKAGTGASKREIVTIKTGWGWDEVEIKAFDGRTWLSDRSMAINIAFRDGTIWSVRQVTGCDVISEGRVNNCLAVPDHWELLHRKGVVVSTALTEWFERVEEYMPSVEHYGVPDQIRLGEPFAISGAGYHEGDRVELSIEFIDQSKLPLGEAPLDHGAFRWDGESPETAPTGYAIVSMRVFEGAEEVGGLTVSTTVARSTAAGATTPSATPAEAEYSAADLARWYERLVDVTWRVPGIAWTDLNEAKNRIEIGIYPLSGAREEWEAALATLDVPREAIVIEIGCEGIRQWPLDLVGPPDEAFLSTIDYSLEVMAQASYGETVRMRLTLRNDSDDPVSFSLGGRPPYDFVVSTPDGEQVWHWKCGKITNLPLDSQTLEPGEELEFVGEWEQVDNRGEPVPPGVYSVRAVLNLESPEKLVTEVHKVEVQVATNADSPSPTTTPTPVPIPTKSVQWGGGTGIQLDTSTPIPIPAASRGRIKVPPHGPGAEIGTAYPYALYVHCGVRDARFDGRIWMADPMLSDGSGSPPPDWTADDSVGVMELVNHDLAVFFADSGRIIEFKPWPLDVEWRPCF